MKTILANILLLTMSVAMVVAQTDNTKAASQNHKSAAKASASKTTEQKLNGWVSDEKCGAKIDADCAKKCEAAGVPVVFVNNDKTIMHVANPESLRGLAGQHVDIKGKVENGTVTVSSVKPSPEAGK